MIAINIFWYIALFPGRLGYDYSLAIRIMQRGESTDWWTASYWWFLRLTTFDGKTIALSSLLTLLVLSTSLHWFIFSLPSQARNLKISFLIMLLTPIYGGFAVNVTHDVFQASGILLLIGIQIRIFRKIDIAFRHRLILESSAAILLLTTKSGFLIITANIIIILLQRRFKLSILIVSISLVFNLVSGFGVTHGKNPGIFFLVAGDLKCVTQHVEARISAAEWLELEKIASIEKWKTSVPCWYLDDSLAILGDTELKNMKRDLQTAKLYASIVFKNPAIVVMAHLHRASMALPPPFFHGPDNQVILDPKVPIGLGTNIALQSGPELLHPSIDEPSVNPDIALLKPIEAVAQLPIFLVNQASWFWGWGGLWLWPIFIYFIHEMKIRKMKYILQVSAPIVTIHFFLVILSPAPLGRYVMGTILTGVTLTILMLVNYCNRPVVKN